ncbi:hypothetical protein ACFZCV_33865 [Streptomyces sp. NPDC007920]|uniref:hypothetical protein n=1 Tax=Streptomyces sp. NPDC007920 TaxID=3364794 RepID=UPI0036E526B0
MTTNDLWRPLSERASAGAPALRTSVSGALETQLRQWTYRAISHDSAVLDRIVLRCDLRESHRCRRHDLVEGVEPPDDWEPELDHLAYCTPPAALPDVIDAWLHLTAPSAPARTLPAPSNQPVTKLEIFAAAVGGLGELQPRVQLRRSLQRLLDDGRSAYTLRADQAGLRQRVDPTVEALAEAAVTSAGQDPARGSAGAHLKRAWKAAYALHPEPGKAYGEAIKAVEAAAHATVEPNNSKATLGTMIKVMENTPARWVVGIGSEPSSAGAETVARMMRLLWTGQTSRHGGSRPTRDETVAEARAAVHLAVALLNFFTDGILVKQPPES